MLKRMNRKPVVFCAGNSGGDNPMVDYVLGSTSKHFRYCIAVNPSIDLQRLLVKYPNNLLPFYINNKSHW